MKKNRGFTLIEMLMAIIIAGVCITIVSLSFSKINSNEALDKSTDLVVSVLDEARASTLSGKDGYQHSVNLQASQVVLFQGTSYSAGTSTNVTTSLNNLVGIRNISLSGGGSSVIFDKLTGETSKQGSLEVYLLASTTLFHTITINSAGSVEAD